MATERPGKALLDWRLSTVFCRAAAVASSRTTGSGVGAAKADVGTG
jgi:hypothetical protein